MHLDRRLLGWGLFFILLGTVPIATRAGLLDEQVVGQWSLLWPVLLIGWGLGLLLRGTPLAQVGGAVVAVTLGIMGGGALTTGFSAIPFASGCSGNDPVTAFTDRTGDFGSTARVDLQFNCGSLTVGTADGTAWRVSGSDRDGAGPALASGQDALSLDSDPGRQPFGANSRSVWNVTLPRSPVLALGVTLNAGEGNLDLAGASISTVSMTLNAGSMTLDMRTAAQVGDVNATVNAGAGAMSLPGGDRALNLSLNAGTLTVCVPPGSPLRVQWSGAIGSNNFDAIGLVKTDNQTWTSTGFDAGQAHLDMNVSANAGSFELQFGGTCDA